MSLYFLSEEYADTEEDVEVLWTVLTVMEDGICMGAELGIGIISSPALLYTELDPKDPPEAWEDTPLEEEALRLEEEDEEEDFLERLDVGAGTEGSESVRSNTMGAAFLLPPEEE